MNILRGLCEPTALRELMELCEGCVNIRTELFELAPAELCELTGMYRVAESE